MGVVELPKVFNEGNYIMIKDLEKVTVLEVKEVAFNNNFILGVKTSDGKIYASIKKFCDDLGLKDHTKQITKIKKIFSRLCKKPKKQSLFVINKNKGVFVFFERLNSPLNLCFKYMKAIFVSYFYAT